MRLLQLCRRKYVVFLLVLITTLSVIWTYWIGTRLQHKSEIPDEGFQSMKNRLKHVKQEEFNILRVNGARVQQHELSLTRKRENYVPYSVTRKSKVALEITDRGLLQRLQEVKIFDRM